MAEISVTLPDGSAKTVPANATLADVAAAIGKGLAKVAIAGVVNGEQVDLATPVAEGDKVSIITETSPEGLEILRHSTSHLMAQAVKALFPAAKVTIGPAVETGFYYDFDKKQNYKIKKIINFSKDNFLRKFYI